ncbi:MAG: glycosyltransferase family 4 protein [Gemmatimonadota bacterium]|nr:glycosyltransferase family 4 protein [Gemmatimonadota bacterium]
MNILFFEQNSGVGGGEIWMVDAARKLRERGHETFLLCPSDAWVARQAEAQNLPYLDYFIEDDGHLHWRLLECLRKNRIDLVFSGVLGRYPRLALLDSAIREVGRCGLILRIGVARSMVGWPIGLGLVTVLGVVVVSQDIKNILVRSHPNYPSELIHVCYNGVDLQRFNVREFGSIDRQALHKSIGIPNHHAVICALGRIHGPKGLSLLVQASKNVLKRYPKTCFLVVGQGEYKSELVETTRQAKVEDHFYYTGFVENVPRMLSGIDILVHPSMSEGLPNAVLEAMAMGKPVVATAVGGVTELIEDGKSGVLVPSQDQESLTRALCMLLGDPHKRMVLGNGGLKRARMAFDRKRRLDELEALLMQKAERIRNVKYKLSGNLPPRYDFSERYFGRACVFRHSIAKRDFRRYVGDP